MSLSLYMASPADGTLRIVVDQGEDEPPYLPSVFTLPADSPLLPIVKAAVAADSGAVNRDKDGLFWMDKTSAVRAFKAAKRAATRAGGK